MGNANTANRDKRDASPSLVGSNLYQSNIAHFGSSHLGYGQSQQQEQQPYYSKYNQQQSTAPSFSQQENTVLQNLSTSINNRGGTTTHGTATSAMDENNFSANMTSVQGMSLSELQKEVVESREKIKAITQKFTTVRKERDTLKQENKELQEEVLGLQSSIRNMVPCFSNTSSAFPMQNELANIVSEFYKCDCQDCFFDILSPELNLEGVVFFFQNTLPPVIEAIEKHFQPVEITLKKVSLMQAPLADGPIVNVLRKTYQQNWKAIHQQCLTTQYHEATMRKVQGVLSIADESPSVNLGIVNFLKKLGEVAFQMMVSDPPIVFDMKRIGEKVQFNQYKYDSLDGFIKTNDECLIILPSVHKYSSGAGLGEVVIKPQVLPLNYEFP